MANSDRTIKTKLILEGEREYRQNMSAITAALKENTSQTALLSAEYVENADSAQALAAKTAVLSARMELQQQKVVALSSRLDRAKEAQERANSTVDKAAKELDKQRTALEKLESAQESSTEAIKAQRDAVAYAEAALQAKQKALFNTTKGIDKFKTSLNYAQKDVLVTAQALHKSKNETGDLNRSIIDLAENIGVKLPPNLSTAIESLNGGAMATAAWAAAAGGLLTMLSRATMDTAAYVDEIATTATVTGISTESLQVWKYAAGLMDIELGTVTGSLSRMTKSMSTARKGTGESAEAFTLLGVQLTGPNNKLRDVEAVFWDCIRALGNMTNETERDAAAMAIFGKSAKDLNTVIAAGEEGFNAMAMEAQNMGFVMGEDKINKFNQLADAMDRFDNVQQAVKQNMAEALLPIITVLFEMLAKIDPKIIATVTIIATVATVVISVMNAIKSATETAGSFGDFFTELNPKVLKTTAIIVGVVAALILLAIAIAHIVGEGESLSQSLDSASRNVTSMVNTTVPKYASGTSRHPGGWAMVGEEGRELVWLPTGSMVLPNPRTEQMMNNTPQYANGIGIPGGVYVEEHNTYEFKVDNMDLFTAICNRVKSERMSRRKGYISN